MVFSGAGNRIIPSMGIPGPWFTAACDGECAGCFADIGEGDEIRADGEGGYLCEPCGEAAEEPA